MNSLKTFVLCATLLYVPTGVGQTEDVAPPAPAEAQPETVTEPAEAPAETASESDVAPAPDFDGVMPGWPENSL